MNYPPVRYPLRQYDEFTLVYECLLVVLLRAETPLSGVELEARAIARSAYLGHKLAVDHWRLYVAAERLRDARLVTVIPFYSTLTSPYPTAWALTFEGWVLACSIVNRTHTKHGVTTTPNGGGSHGG